MSRGHVLLGISGGIAAYKSATLTSRLVQAGFDVQVAMTPAAEHFMGPATFAALSGHRVITDGFDADSPLGPHIELPRQTQLLCVAPATANFLAKAAHGLADDLLSTLYLAFSGPILAAPAMNSEMWEKAAVQRNVRTVQQDGVQLVGPNTGWLSCRVQGAGRMAEPDEILTAICTILDAPTSV